MWIREWESLVLRQDVHRQRRSMDLLESNMARIGLNYEKARFSGMTTFYWTSSSELLVIIVHTVFLVIVTFVFERGVTNDQLSCCEFLGQHSQWWSSLTINIRPGKVQQIHSLNLVEVELLLATKANKDLYITQEVSRNDPLNKYFTPAAHQRWRLKPSTKKIAASFKENECDKDLHRK